MRAFFTDPKVKIMRTILVLLCAACLGFGAYTVAATNTKAASAAYAAKLARY